MLTNEVYYKASQNLCGVQKYKNFYVPILQELWYSAGKEGN